MGIALCEKAGRGKGGCSDDVGDDDGRHDELVVILNLI